MVSAGTIENVAPLDFRSPFDELTELRELLTTQEIAEVTGLRRETISRARPDSRFQRRTAKALEDLYRVVARLRSARGDEMGQLGAVLRRPQSEFGGRSIAELLRDGQVDVVLRSLSTGAAREASHPEVQRAPTLDEQIDAVLDADRELKSRVGAIEAALLEHFGPGARVERKIISDYEEEGGSDELYLRVHTSLSVDEEIDRLGEFLRRHEDLLNPVHRSLVIGFLG
jgi:hypothetical protein